jgi:hypothetical protein
MPRYHNLPGEIPFDIYDSMTSLRPRSYGARPSIRVRKENTMPAHTMLRVAVPLLGLALASPAQADARASAEAGRQIGELAVATQLRGAEARN